MTLGLSLAGQGRIAEALALLESADPDLDADLGSEHPLRILYGLNRATLLHRSRRATEAARLVDAVLPKMRAAFGAAAPAVTRAEALGSENSSRLARIRSRPDSPTCSCKAERHEHGPDSRAEFEELHVRHGELIGEIRELARRLDDVNGAIQSKELPEGVPFDEMGLPIRERP